MDVAAPSSDAACVRRRSAEPSFSAAVEELGNSQSAVQGPLVPMRSSLPGGVENVVSGAMTQTAAPTRAGSQRLREVESLVRVVSATVIIGAGGCAVIGGLGVRLAMRILFLTSGDGVKGLTSDDGSSVTPGPGGTGIW
jgi:hypothetical protein